MKLQTKKEREKAERRKQIIFAIVVAVIMIASVIGFTLELSREKEINPYHQTIDIYGRKITITHFYLKNETADVDIDFVPSLDYFLGKKFYFYLAPQLTQNLRLLQYLSYFTLLNEACLNESITGITYQCYNEELPLKTCDDDIIVFQYSNDTEIKRYAKCIILSGNETTIEKTIDRFLYELFP